VDVDVLAVGGGLAAADVALFLHGADGGEGAGLGDAGLGGELALRQAVALPEDAQEGPVAERHAVRGELRLQRAREAAPRLLGQVREALV
jgi:hypothetical protein